MKGAQDYLEQYNINATKVNECWEKFHNLKRVTTRLKGGVGETV